MGSKNSNAEDLHKIKLTSVQIHPSVVQHLFASTSTTKLPVAMCTSAPVYDEKDSIYLFGG